MAGATVFQLEPFPIDTEHIMTDATAFDTPFFNNIADYMHEVDNRDLVCEYLAESLCKYNNEARELIVVTRNAENHIQALTFKEGFREAYFAGAYAAFMKRLADISTSTTLSTFAEGKLEVPLFELNSAYNDEFSNYVCTNECEFITFDEFIRTAQVDVPYYIGGVMNYHF